MDRRCAWLSRRNYAPTRVLATVPNFDSTSHLRFFTDDAAVVERYGQSLDRLIVTRVSLRRESAILLLDGVALGPAGR